MAYIVGIAQNDFSCVKNNFENLFGNKITNQFSSKLILKK